MAETPVTSNLGWDNFFSTTTTGALTATTTTIPLATPPTPTEGFLVLDPGGANEIIFYNSVSGNSVIVPTTDDRGRGDSTAQSHSSGITVKMNTVGMMFEALQSGLGLSATFTAPAGTISSEYLNATIACRAYRSAALTLANTGPIKIALDAENFDLGSDFDTSNSRFVAPVTGYYQVNACLAIDNLDATGNNITVYIYVNGAEYSKGKSIIGAPNNDPIATVSDLVPVTAGQYIEMYGAHSSATSPETLTVGSSSLYMSIYFVGV